jgi:hypothetical protein
MAGLGDGPVLGADNHLLFVSSHGCKRKQEVWGFSHGCEIPFMTASLHVLITSQRSYFLKQQQC